MLWGMKPADEVKQYASDHYIAPARAAGKSQVIICSGDIHSALKFKNRYPLVCAALGGVGFQRTHSIVMRNVTSPMNSSTTTFTFELLS
jgi:hypothetical protein